MRLVTLILAAAAFAAGESHPSWWTLTPPDATALVGIDWEVLRNSPFAGAIRAGLPDFPDLPLLFEARQILISSPAALVILKGEYEGVTLQQQALTAGMKRSSYRGVELFLSSRKGTLSVARFSDQILLAGSRKTLEAVIDRSLSEARRDYSPLLAGAARLAEANDFWVIATQLPDPLASLFVPIEADARGFEGGVSLRAGLRLDASLSAATTDDAEAVAGDLRASIPDLPSFARSMQVDVESRNVLIHLAVPPDQLAAALRTAEPATANPAAGVREAAPVEAPPAGPQVIRIFGLDEGPREIILPPAKPEKPR